MKNTNFFELTTKKAELPKLKETIGGGVFSFFTQKSIDIITLTLYKSQLFLGFSDSTISNYDLITVKEKIEINQLIARKVNLIKLDLLHELYEYIDSEYLVCLCDVELIVLDLHDYTPVACFKYKGTALNYHFDFYQNSLRFLIICSGNLILTELTANLSILLLL